MRPPRELLAQRPDHRRGKRFDHRHLETSRSGRGGDFRTDEPGADHDNAAAALKCAAYPQRVGLAAQGMHPLQIMSKGKCQWTCTRCDDQAVELDLETVVHPKYATGNVQRSGPAPAKQLEIQFPELVLRAQRQPVDVPFAGQQLFRKRRPVIGSLSLVPDQRDRTLKPLLAQCLASRQASQGSADDHHSFHGQRLSRAVSGFACEMLRYDAFEHHGKTPTT